LGFLELAMECLERCLHQVFKSESAGSSFLYNGNGAGDCCACSYDSDNNNHCAKYTPIKVWPLEVVDNKEK